MSLAALAPFVSAGASLLGSQMQANASARSARLNAMYQAGQQQADRDANAILNDRQEAMWNVNRMDSQNLLQIQLNEAEKDRAIQEEFAKNGVQWRVSDAQKAGIHPLAALGFQGPTSSAITVSGGGGAGSASFTPQRSDPISPFSGASMGAGIAAAGQDISRALQATRSDEARTAAVIKTQQDLQIQNMTLQNELLATQIAKTAQVGPPMPNSRRNMIDGQGNTPKSLTKNEPLERITPMPGNPEQEPNFVSEVGYTQDRQGHRPVVMSKDAKERLEEDFLGTLAWNLRNRIAPIVGLNMTPPAHVALKPGHKWVFNPIMSRYEQTTPMFPGADRQSTYERARAIQRSQTERR